MRNVVLVTMDSLRADHVGCTGGLDLTPAIDALAEGGTVFTNALAPAPRTPESMPAITTGGYPVEAGDDELRTQGERTRRHLLARDPIALRFQRAGYATAGFTANGFTSRFFGYERGFDHFEDFFAQRSRVRELPGPLGTLYKLATRDEKFRSWETFVDDIESWTAGTRQPYFLWVFLMDTHSPYLPAGWARRETSLGGMAYANWHYWRHNFADVDSPRAARLLEATYRDSIRYADAFVARLRESLPGDPVFVVHGDHGEGFGDHGHWGHGHVLHEENLHVPLVVSTGDAVVERPVSLRHLPDLLDALREDRDLASAVPEGPVVAHTRRGETVAVRAGAWKLLDGPDGARLYDLGTDPGERTDRAADEPAATAALRLVAARHRSGNAEQRAVREAVATLGGGL